jgi:hypothetical protein
MKNHIPTLRKLYLKIDCTNKYPKDSWIMWVLLLFVSVVCTYMSYKYDCTFRAPLTLHEWSVHNRLFNAYYEVKLKKNIRYV